MVDRYIKYSGGMIKLPETTKDGSGSFVRYENYEALEAKLSALVGVASKAYSDWDGGSPEESVKSMRSLGKTVEAAKMKP